MIKDANSKKDFRQTWQAINKALKRGNKKLISPTNLSLDGVSSSNTKIIANILNKHFTSVAEKLAHKLPAGCKDASSFLKETRAVVGTTRPLGNEQLLD